MRVVGVEGTIDEGRQLKEPQTAHFFVRQCDRCGGKLLLQTDELDGENELACLNCGNRVYDSLGTKKPVLASRSEKRLTVVNVQPSFASELRFKSGNARHELRLTIFNIVQGFTHVCGDGLITLPQMFG